MAINKKNLGDKGNPRVSVIIPTKDRPKMLERCLNSVLLSTYTNLEIIVSDDSKSSESKETVEKFKNKFQNIKYIHNTENNISVAINRAIKQSNDDNSDFTFILDDDNEIDKNCIKELTSSMVKGKNVGIVGPIAFYYSNRNIIMHAGTIRSKFMRRALYVHENERWANQINEGYEVEDFANAFMFRKEAVKKVGMWDLLVPFMGEDADFEARVRKAGYKVIINPKAITYHDIPYNPKEIYFLRVSESRMYHPMHSKVLYVFRYDSTLQKLTFTISVPLYIAFYIRAIIKDKNRENKKLKLIRALFKGTCEGFIDAFRKKSEIERL